MRLKLLFSTFIYFLIGVIILFQTNLVLAIASDPNNPITSAITTAINTITDPSPTPSPSPTDNPISGPITNPTPTPTPTSDPITAPIINPSPTPTPSPTSTPTPVVDNNTSYNLGVLVLKYFPLTSNGQNIDIAVTGDVGDSYSTIRQRTIDGTNNLKSDIENGSRYLGYKNPDAPASLNLNIVDTKEFTYAVPIQNGSTNKPDLDKILTDQNICNLVDNQNVKEVWLWAYQGSRSDGQPFLSISESQLTGPFVNWANGPYYNAPICQHTYRILTFNYQVPGNAYHSWGHEMEFEIRAVDANLFSKFQGPAHPQTDHLIGRCGSVHNPPNSRQEYDYSNPNPKQSDCLDWNPDGQGTLSNISCSTWNPNCIINPDPSLSQNQYLVWMWQNLPGRNNTKTYQGKSLRNWWDVHGDFDNVINNKTLLVSQNTPTPSPTPAPVVVTPVIDSVSPNPATQGTVITITGSGFSNLSQVYVGGVLMPTQFDVVSDNGNSLSFLLTTEVNFIPNNTYNIYIANGNTNSSEIELTVAPSIIQTIPPINPNQVLVAPAVNLDTDHPEVVLASSNFNTAINIPSSVTHPTINFSNLLSVTGSSATASFNNMINISSATSLGEVNVQIPALTNITGPADWNGIVNTPQVQSNSSVTPVADPNTAVTTSEVIEVGLGDTYLSFDKAIRILIPNQAGKLVGFQRGSTFTKIASSCSADTQTSADSLPAGGECYISAGNDLVIWTKHFTKFATYTETTVSDNNSNNNSQSNNSSTPGAPVCGDTKPQSSPKLLSATVSGRNEATLVWSKALDPVTYYLVAYGTKPGVLEYGNPNIGNKNTTSYVVKGLENGKTYYFKVRAGNNCMPGDFSNEVAVKASGDNLKPYPASGFKQGVLAVQTHSASTEAQLKFKPITSANPQRALIETSNLFTKILSFFQHLFKL